MSVLSSTRGTRAINEPHFYKEINYNLDVMEKTINKGKAKFIDIGFIDIFRTDISTVQSKTLQTKLSERLERLAKQIYAATNSEVATPPVEELTAPSIPPIAELEEELATPSTPPITESAEEQGDTSEEASAYVPDWLDHNCKNVLEGRQNAITLAGFYNLLKHKSHLLTKDEAYGLLYNLAGFGLTEADSSNRAGTIKAVISKFSFQEQLWLYLGTKNHEFIRRAFHLNYILTEKVIEQLREQLRRNLLCSYKNASEEVKEQFLSEIEENLKTDLGL